MAAAAAAAVAAVVPFALNPAEALQGIVIDFTTEQGRDFHTKAIAPLEGKKNKFDCDVESLRDFRRMLSVRALIVGWIRPDGVLMVPPDPANPLVGNRANLIDQYGERTIDVIREYELTFVFTQTRLAQDTNMLFHCLWSSLSQAGRDKISLFHNEYHIAPPADAAAGQLTLPSGGLLLKVILRESHIDSRASSSSIRKKMANLPAYMRTCGSNILEFNQYVKALQEGLAARGENSTDLLVNIIEAYKSVQDKDFHEYISGKESRHDDGELELTVATIMQLAVDRYKILVDRESWMAQTPEQQEIVALESRLTAITQSLRNQESGTKGGKTNKKDSDTY